jgi:valyl-tRNA synthetase
VECVEAGEDVGRETVGCRQSAAGSQVVAEIEELYRDFRLSEILKTIYSLIWDDFCSWYLEWVKPGFEQPIDKTVYEKTVEFFEQLVQLLHPFMPFITEEIYHTLRQRKDGDDLTVRKDLSISTNKPYLNQIKLTELSKELIKKIREFRNNRNIKKDKPVGLIPIDFPYDNSELNDRIKLVNAEAKVTRTTDEKINEKEAVKILVLNPKNLELILVDKYKFYIDLNELYNILEATIINQQKKEQKEQLIKDLDYQKGFLASVEKKLSNERFVQNAKPEVIDIERKKKADAEAKIKAIEESLLNL